MKYSFRKGPSFLEDPSGYLAKQTALLNSTISRQTGVNGNTYLPQPKPSPTQPYSNGKNNPTSPVFVHSSMTPNSVGSATESEGGSPMSCRGCATSADTQSLSSSTQDSYKQRNEVKNFKSTF